MKQMEKDFNKIKLKRRAGIDQFCSFDLASLEINRVKSDEIHRENKEI